MTFRLDFGDDLPASVRRVAAEQLGGAVEQLADGHAEDPVGAVHDVRKRLKRTRALLRLAEPAMRPKQFRRRNRTIRDQGRLLSGTRDADVMVETVDKLAERFAGHEPAALFDTARAPLAERAAATRGGDDPTGHADGLRALLADAEEWPVGRLDARTLVAGLGLTYERGRAGYAIADADPSAHNLHEWRKRVKDLWYQLQLVEEAWPGPLQALAKEAKALSEVLGDDHDLAVLADQVGEDAEADADRLRELIAHRREELLDEARALGSRLYAESPKAFRRRVGAYVRSTAREAAVA